VFKHIELGSTSTRYPLKHQTSLGVGSHSTSPLGLASITSDPWQIALKSNVGSPTMNINEVDSPPKQL
jgi:hypothetical protein